MPPRETANAIPPGKTGDSYRDFLRGASRPSLPAALGTLGVAAGLWLASAATFDAEFVAALEPGRLMLSPRDDYALLTIRALRLQQDPLLVPAVALTGASATREAITGTHELETELEDRLGRSFPVLDLTAGNLGFWELSAVADALGEGFDGVVLIAVSPTHLARDEEDLAELVAHPRLGLDSEAYREEIERAGLEAPRSTGVYLLDHFAFLAARRSLLVKPWRRPIEPRRHRFANRRPFDEREWERMLETVRTRLEGYHENREVGLASIARTIERLRSRGDVEIVLHETPRNPALDGSVYPHGLLQDHARRMQAFASELGVHYWSLREEAELGPDDFFDYCHLKDRDGIARYTAVLVARLSALLERWRAG